MKIAPYLIQNSVLMCAALCMNTTLSQIGEERVTEKHESLKIISTTKAGDVPYGVYAENGYAYITNNDELLIFNVSNPENPKKIGEIFTGVTFNLIVSSGLAYTVGEYGYTIDVSDPSNPRKLGKLPLQGTGHCIWLENNLAYIATSAGLEIIDVADPARPTPVSQCSEGPSRGVVCVKGFAYVANRINGLEVIDVTNPANPEKITTLPGTQAAWNIHVHEDFLFLGRHQNGIDIFSIADKKTPRLVGSFNDDDGGEALSVWGDDNYLFVADNFGVEVLDIHDPAHPRQVEELPGLGCTHDICVVGTLLFIASVKKDLIILEFTSE